MIQKEVGLQRSDAKLMKSIWEDIIKIRNKIILQMKTAMNMKNFMKKVSSGKEHLLQRIETVEILRGLSEKSNRIFVEIETLSPDGRYLEVFARTNNLRPGWVSLGNEFENRTTAETGSSVFREGSVAQVAQQLEGSPVDLDQKLSVEPGGAGRLAGELKILLDEHSEEVKPENGRRK
eukprot:snap_masked-scaffold_70-processed-gene-0.16-mRNA-1 protein AED:1.00 eAED:1.00 QI:0/0/0/0/1/1/2/0/177